MVADSKKSLAIECCILYFEKRMRQEEIAAKLGISRAYVSRLLAFAIEERLVRIKVVLPDTGRNDEILEMEFMDRYPGLKRVFILKSGSESYSSNEIGQFTSDSIEKYLDEARSIGLSQGISVEKAIGALSSNLINNLQKKELIQLTGNLMSYNEHWSQPHEILSSLSKKYHGVVYFLNSPIYIADPDLCLRLREEESIASVSQHFSDIDVALLGIESAVDHSKLYPFMNDKGREEIKTGNAVGNIAANYFDKDGKEVSVMANHKIGIGFENMKNIRNKIVIGYGQSKVAPIHAALNGKLIDILVTDSMTADSILNYQK